MTMKTILVASATANTGSKVAELLSASGQVKVKALARNLESAGAKALAALPNVTLLKGDFDDAASLNAALEGVDRAFLVTGAGEDQQYDREVTFIAAAAAAGTEVVVRISTANVLISLDSTGVYARAHARIEQYIAEHKSKVIDLNPNWFMSNWLSSTGEAKATGKITYPVPADSSFRFAMIDPRDVAGAAAAILLLPSNKLPPLLAAGRLQVHGPEAHTFAELAAAISAAAGKEIKVQYIEPDAWSAMLQGFGVSKYFADSLRDTVLMCSAQIPTKRPAVQVSSPELLAVWQPKYTPADWAKENAAAFA